MDTTSYKGCANSRGSWQCSTRRVEANDGTMPCSSQEKQWCLHDFAGPRWMQHALQDPTTSR
eukprot:1288101-Amphidinium_carterae.1